jgi:hypothetical protein
MLKAILRLLALTILLVPPMVCLPALCLPLMRTPEGAQAVFWGGPFSCSFWVLVCSQILASKAWRGAAAVRQWRREQGGFLVTIPRATAWMAFGLFGSFAAELALLAACYPSSGAAFRALLPAATFSPLVFACVWSLRRA